MLITASHGHIDGVAVDPSIKAVRHRREERAIATWAEVLVVVTAAAATTITTRTTATIITTTITLRQGHANNKFLTPVRPRNNTFQYVGSTLGSRKRLLEETPEVSDYGGSSSRLCSSLRPTPWATADDCSQTRDHHNTSWPGQKRIIAADQAVRGGQNVRDHLSEI